MYKISLNEIFSLPSCRLEYQVGDSYCAWSKIACSALKTRQITSSPSYSSGLGDMYPAPQHFFAKMKKLVGSNRFDEVMNINDNFEGRFSENHERAVKLAIQLALESGLVELEESEQELSKELRDFIEETCTNRVPA